VADLLMDALDVYLEAASARVVRPGVFDCALFSADWLRTLGFDDPAHDFRGRYTTWRGMRRVLKRAGGLVAAVRPGLEALGLEHVTSAARGDVGVVRCLASTGDADAAAICLGAHWVSIAPDGLVAGPATPIEIWRPVCPPL
jgi:hypothetical protein